MKNFCVIANREKDENLEMTNQIMDYLQQFGAEVFITRECHDKDAVYTDVSDLPENVECAIVLGGDGTILQAAHDLMTRKIPLLGINLGTLGFLAEIEKQNVNQALQAVVNGQFQIEERMMLDACVIGKENSRSDKICNPALNDIVITRSGFSRIIGVSIYVNGAHINNFRGDGVIISTPTGSTGYNLSAGGPVVTPGAETVIITPICPHTLNARSIVVKSSDTVLVKIMESKKTQAEEAIVTMDGGKAIKLRAGDNIEITRASEVTKLIRVEQNNFFQILRSKLGDFE